MNLRSRIAALALLLALPAWAGPAPATGDDPYRWLEQVDSPASLQWVRAENAKTLGVLEKDPRFEANLRQATAIAETRDRIATPEIIGGRVYNFWRDADHVRGIWRRTSLQDYESAQPHWQTVIDLDALAAQEKANWVWKGTVCEPRRQRRCLVLLSDGGEDAVTTREFDLASARFVRGGFQLPRGKVRLAWWNESELLVAREWQPGELTSSGYPYVVKTLRRGQPLDRAVELFRGSAADGGYGVAPEVYVDAAGHRAALIERSVSTFESEQYLVGRSGPQRLALPPKSEVIGLVGDRLLVRLRQPWAGAPEGALVALDAARAAADPARLEPVVVWAPGPRETLDDDAVEILRDAIVVGTLDNVRGRVAIYRVDARGAWAGRTITGLPDNASISLVTGDDRGRTAYVEVAGFLQPSSLWRIDADAGAAAQIKSLPAQFDAAGLEVRQWQAKSSDGTMIPYFVIGARDLQPDARHPTVLYGYGGFNVSLTPFYAGTLGKLWLDRGGVFVVANIRGGGEFGPAWHDAGLKTKRQIVYDDFAAVARDLIARRITSPRRLGIQGGSNGGLLMGVEMTQHPELFHAVDIQVPLLDMLRYEQIAAGPSWVGEYGSVSVPAERDFLARISPYANLKRGVDYPLALIWTTTKDDRVGPQHARKFAARLGEYGIPYYFYEVIEGGHGSGANLNEMAHTRALEWTYFQRRLMGD
ncbi:MAG: S9 family peptidase [Burkholderiales bacterium]|nr:prolyl oligopeptidase family serine peptidase [Burkholderiales bacterium]MDE1926932.1 S9 family peptidase [Burkholderiales bacterium]MDE2501972.1 S9 family peptidase [Burkholderiales bacterium]